MAISVDVGNKNVAEMFEKITFKVLAQETSQERWEIVSHVYHHKSGYQGGSRDWGYNVRNRSKERQFG